MQIPIYYAQFGGGDNLMVSLLPLLLIFVVFYFLLIRPQQKRMKDHKSMIAAVKRGDVVVTGGGIIGKVSRVKDEDVQVEIADGVRVNVLRDTLSSVRSRGEPAADRGPKTDSKPESKGGGLFSKLKR